MERKFFDPPAQVQEYEEAFGAILKRAGALNTEIKRNDKLNIQKALEIGRMLLRARPMVQDDWEKTLEEVGISRQRASDFSWGAEQAPHVQFTWESIADLRRSRTEQSTPRESALPQKGQGAPASSTNAATPPKWPENNRCRKCRVSGKNDPKCKGCKDLNSSTLDTTWAENLDAREEHGPGADDGDLDEAATALAAALAKKIRAGMDRAAFRYCKLVATSLCLEVTLQGDGANPTFGHPLIQQAYKKMTQAKWDLSNALKVEKS